MNHTKRNGHSRPFTTKSSHHAEEKVRLTRTDTLKKNRRRKSTLNETSGTQNGTRTITKQDACDLDSSLVGTEKKY